MCENDPLNWMQVIILISSIKKPVLSISTVPPNWGKMSITQKCFELNIKTENTKIQKSGLFISGRQHSAGTTIWPEMTVYSDISGWYLW